MRTQLHSVTQTDYFPLLFLICLISALFLGHWPVTTHIQILKVWEPKRPKHITKIDCSEMRFWRCKAYLNLMPFKFTFAPSICEIFSEFELICVYQLRIYDWKKFWKSSFYFYMCREHKYECLLCLVRRDAHFNRSYETRNRKQPKKARQFAWL